MSDPILGDDDGDLTLGGDDTEIIGLGPEPPNPLLSNKLLGDCIDEGIFDERLLLCELGNGSNDTGGAVVGDELKLDVLIGAATDGTPYITPFCEAETEDSIIPLGYSTSGVSPSVPRLPLFSPLIFASIASRISLRVMVFTNCSPDFAPITGLSSIGMKLKSIEVSPSFFRKGSASGAYSGVLPDRIASIARTSLPITCKS